MTEPGATRQSSRFSSIFRSSADAWTRIHPPHSPRTIVVPGGDADGSGRIESDLTGADLIESQPRPRRTCIVHVDAELGFPLVTDEILLKTASPRAISRDQKVGAMGGVVTVEITVT